MGVGKEANDGSQPVVRSMPLGLWVNKDGDDNFTGNDP